MAVNYTPLTTGAAAQVLNINNPLQELDNAIKKNEYAKTARPTVNDDSGDGYTVGSRWIDTTNDAVWVCVDATLGAAVWQPLSKRPSFAANKGDADQTITKNLATLVTFTTEVFDTLADYTAASSRWVPSVPGKYLVQANVEWPSPEAAKGYVLYLYKNGAEVARLNSNSVGTDPLYQSVSFLASMNGTSDYLECYAFHNSTSDKDIEGAISYSYFFGTYVSS